MSYSCPHCATTYADGPWLERLGKDCCKHFANKSFVVKDWHRERCLKAHQCCICQQPILAGDTQYSLAKEVVMCKGCQRNFRRQKYDGAE